MSIEFGLSVEWLLTQLTQIRTFSCMYPFVDYKMLVFNEWFITLSTRKTFFTFVISHMSCNLWLCKERQVTQLTRKGLMSSMEQFMPFKTWLCEERLSTRTTGKIINPWVPFLMCLEIRECRKSLLAKCTCIRLLLWQTKYTFFEYLILAQQQLRVSYNVCLKQLSG